MLVVGGCAAAGPEWEPAVAGAAPTKRDVEVIAHRGASAACPENTWAAFRRAVEVGADRIELDVQLSRDGGVVVFHDTDLDRTTDGSGPVTGTDLDDLLRLDAGSWFSAEFPDERIPLLSKVLPWSALHIPLNVELKVEGGGTPALALTRAAIDLIQRHGAARSTIVSSFDPVAVAEAARLCPECEVALLWDGRGDGDPLVLVRRAGARALHLALRGLSVELAERARAEGIPLRVYTVNSEEDLRRVLEHGGAGVFTDRPADVRAWLGR